MGTVHLTSGHHGLVIRDKNTDFGRRVKLEPAWLDRNVVVGEGGLVAHDIQLLTKAALRALLALPFDSAVSFGVCNIHGSPQIQIPKRVWGEITLGDPRNVIVRFSHDSRFENRPYRSLYHWLEGQWNPHSTPDEDAKFWQDWSDPCQWETFFKLLLWQAGCKMLEEAKTLQSRVSCLQQQANKINSLLK